MLAQKIIQLLQKTDVEFTAVTKEELDLTSFFNISTFIQHNPGFTNIINAAAMTNVDQCEVEKEKCRLNNLSAVENLAKVCRNQNIHLVHVSTDFVFDGSKNSLTEDDETNPLNYYGQCKLEAEKAVLDYNNSAVLRTQFVYGLSKKQNVVLWIKKSLEEGKEISLYVDQWRTPTFVDDLATACIKACEINAKGIYHISGKDTLTPYWLGVEIAKFYNLNQALIKKTDTELTTQKAVDGRILWKPYPDLHTACAAWIYAGGAHHTCYSTAQMHLKAKRDLQYEPHSIIESFKAMQLAEQSA